MRRLSRVNAANGTVPPVDEPLVSALMIVRNRADLLPAAVASVLGQTHRTVELLIVDDGSTDDTPTVIEQLAATDDRVRITPNRGTPGIPGARNHGLSQAQGEFLAICDSDDLSRPQRFADQVEQLRRQPRWVGVGSQINCFATTPETGSVPSWRWGIRLGRPPFPFPTAMFRSAALRAVGGFDESFPVAEDLDLAFRLVGAGGELAMVDDVLVDYRMHGQGITAAHPRLARLTLRAQVRGLRQVKGVLRPGGYARVAQSLWRATAEQVSQSRRG